MSRLIIDPTPQGTPDALRRMLDAFVQSVREILVGGWRWREQVEHVIDVTLDTGDLPITVAVSGLRERPLGVVMLRATVEGDTGETVISGGHVTWSWTGDEAVSLSSLGALASSTRYHVTIAVME